LNVNIRPNLTRLDKYEDVLNASYQY